MASSYYNRARTVLSEHNQRATDARVRVLAQLLAAEGGRTHQQIELQLSRTEPIDRVTLYRTLEWLTRVGLAHKIKGADRAWHFSINLKQDEHQHAHFKCKQCHRLVCLNNIKPTRRFALPAGYVTEDVELTITGLCDTCV
jgi:Fur family ferric uptake transcriptional regulator